MTPATIVGLLAEPLRLRVFSAIALGATSLPEVAAAANAPLKDTSGALQRLVKSGLVLDDPGGLTVDTEALRDLARKAESVAPVEDHGSGDQQIETLLRTFTRDGRLIRIPAQMSRRRIVLEHLTRRSFQPGVEYDEKSVNAVLRAWCEASEADHVTIRRYLVDMCLLKRDKGVYWLTEPAG